MNVQRFLLNSLIYEHVCSNFCLYFPVSNSLNYFPLIFLAAPELYALELRGARLGVSVEFNLAMFGFCLTGSGVLTSRALNILSYLNGLRAVFMPLSTSLTFSLHETGFNVSRYYTFSFYS